MTKMTNLQSSVHVTVARQHGHKTPLQSLRRLHAPTAHLLVVIEAVAHARRLQAVPVRAVEHKIQIRLDCLAFFPNESHIHAPDPGVHMLVWQLSVRA